MAQTFLSVRLAFRKVAPDSCRWTSATHYEAFRTKHAEEYRAIDAQCQQLTTAEHHIGSYDTM